MSRFDLIITEVVENCYLLIKKTNWFLLLSQTLG